MRNLVRIGVFVWPLAGLLSSTVAAQDLAPGAYTPAPVGVNVVTMVGSINDGGMSFDPSLPVEEGHATIGAAVVAYNRTLDIAGRFASVGVLAPYVLGHVDGILLGEFQETSRAGLGDLSTRVAINLFGAPAMTLQQFAAYRPTTVLGVSLTVGVPVGQYDPGRVINIGTNRWSIKPEAGFARTRGRWTFEADVGFVFFTDNTDFRNGGSVPTGADPIDARASDLHDPPRLLGGRRRQLLERRAREDQWRRGHGAPAELQTRGDAGGPDPAAAAENRVQLRRVYHDRRRLLVARRVVFPRLDWAALTRTPRR